MKIPTPITEAEYEREINRLVKRFEAFCRQPSRNVSPHSRYGRLVAAFKAAGEPLTAHEAWLRAELDGPLNIIGPHAQKLEESGWIVRVGTKPFQWWNYHATMIREVITYQAADDVPLRQFKEKGAVAAARRLLASVELLDQRRSATSCLAPRVIASASLPRRWAFVDYGKRDAEIMRRRLAGETLRAIAEDYAMTRERVRQIFERLVRATTTADLEKNHHG